MSDDACGACLFIADDHGDNSATIRCQLPPSHDGLLHQEQFERDGGLVTITWVRDERKRCDHGCGQWKHDHLDEVPCPKDDLDHEYSDCAFCNPGKPARMCAACGKTYYYEDGHRMSCVDRRRHVVTPRSEGDGYRGHCTCGWTSDYHPQLDQVGHWAAIHLRLANTAKGVPPVEDDEFNERPDHMRPAPLRGPVIT